MRNPYRTERIAFALLLIATLLIVIPVGLIVAIIIQKGLPAITWQFLTDMPRQGMRAGGIFPAIIGTLYLVSGAILFALPIGLLAAIYLSEYAKDNMLTRMIKLAIVNLAGVPSVVYGLFGLALFVVFFKFGASILAGSLTLGIMILPLIITTSREALESVPQSFREVSLSLGQVYEKYKRKWREENMPNVNATIKLDIGKFKLEDRNRIEYRHFRFKDDSIRYRNKVALKYPIDFKTIKLAPYISNEIFISSNSTGFNEDRFTSGLEMEVSKYAKFEVYYMWKSSRIVGDKWNVANVLGTKIKIAF